MTTQPCATKSISNNGTLDSENLKIVDYDNKELNTHKTYNEARQTQQKHNREERVATATV